MLPDLLPNVTNDKTLGLRLNLLSNNASNVRTSGERGPIVERYLTFCAESVSQLRHSIRPSSIDALIQTRRYWAILVLDPASRTSKELVDLELQDCIARFDAASRGVLDEARLWANSGVLIVPDTNVFLHVLTDTIAAADWRTMAEQRPQVPVTVVLTLAVIDELDKKKHSNLRTKAKAPLREINALLGGFTRASLSVVGGLTDIIVLIDEPDHVPLPHADSEIVDRALTLQGRTASKVVVVTGDTGMKLRALHAGVAVVLLPTPDPVPKTAKR